MRLPLVVVMLALAGCRAPVVAEAAGRAPGAVGAQREIVSTITGDPPNFAQLSNGRMMTVVSREFGRGAKAGALVELYWPQYDTDHLWDAYVGVVRGGKTTWAHDLKLVGQALAPDSGRATTRFAGPGFALAIEDVVAPGADVHLRRATLTNTGSAPLADVALAHFAFFTVNALPAGDRARFDHGVLMQHDGQAAVAVAALPAPDAARTGLANVPVGGARDARLAAEGGDFDGPQAAGPAVGGVDAASRHPLPAIAPGQSASVTWAIAASELPETAALVARRELARGFDAAAAADAERWARWLGAAPVPKALDGDARATYRRALVTLGQHVAANGAIVAAPTNLNPPYRFVWPRDGSLIALTLLATGHRAEAERFFAFAESLQHADGSFAVNYFPKGDRPLWDFGPRGNEHDQPGTFAWAVERTFRTTQDRAWLAARWPAVKKACGFLMAMQAPEGLLGPCRDLWELDSDGSWTYSNGAGWAGLTAGAAIAERLGEPGEAARCREAAARLKAAVGARLAGPQGFGRGLRNGRLDPTVEAANLSLGASAFGMWADDDPRMVATGAAVAGKLTMPGGGVRRYEGDRYYDGQPWPVSTAWLATHQLARGEREAARRGLATMTRWAGTTGSRMLGEQFDEGKQRWASAFPLAWSEAAYVGLALALDGR